MKNECDIVKDLLFSYNDGVLSTTSKEFVEEHLKECKNCKNVLEEIKQENEEQNQVKEIDTFKKIKKQINKKNIVISISLIILFIVVLFNILVYINYNEVASTMEIYLKDDITDEELENIKNKVIEKSDNVELAYISKERALENLKNIVGEDDLFRGYDNQNNIIPASIEIKTNTKVQIIVDAIQDMPGIVQINTHTNYNPYVIFFAKIFEN